MAANLQEARRVFSQAPFIQSLGCELLNVEAGQCHAQLVPDTHHQQQDGFIHAGVQATLADHCAGTAAVTLIAPDQMVLTAEFKINLLRAAKGDRLFCKSSVLKPGRVLIVAESEVFTQQGEQPPVLVAKATVTLAVLNKPMEQEK